MFYRDKDVKMILEDGCKAKVLSLISCRFDPFTTLTLSPHLASSLTDLCLYSSISNKRKLRLDDSKLRLLISAVALQSEQHNLKVIEIDSKSVDGGELQRWVVNNDMEVSVVQCQRRNKPK